MAAALNSVFHDSVDFNTRQLRAFAAVAEELNFTRAACRLSLAQQTVSKQVRELEAALGAPLFRRSTKKVELTPAGEALRGHVDRLIAELDTGVRSARRAAGLAKPTLRLGFSLGAALEFTPLVLQEFRERHPDVQLDLREYDFADPSAGLADASSDVAFVRQPMTFTDIEFEPLFAEPIVAIIGQSHRFATRQELAVADLLSEPMTVGRTDDAVWRSHWLLEDYRAGELAPKVIYVSRFTEELEIIAAGEAITISTAASARYLSHPALRFVPVTDLPPSCLGLAWRVGARNPLIAAVLHVVQDVRDRETELVERIASVTYPSS